MKISQLASDHEALALVLLFGLAVIALGSVVFFALAVLNKGSNGKGKETGGIFAKFIRSLMPW